MPNTISKINLNGNIYDIQGDVSANDLVVDITQAEYDNLATKEDKIYNITDAEELSSATIEAKLDSYAKKTDIPDTSSFATKDDLNNKQGILVSGTNIKTVGGTSLLGSGNITLPTLPSNIVTGNSKSYKVWNGTQTEYDAITTKDENTIYLIVE